MSEYNFTPTYRQYPSIDPRNINKYEFVSDFYNGSLSDGSYLLPFARESFYEERKKLAAYRNFLKPIIRAKIDPVISNPIIRETSNALYEEFLLDTDNRQNSMTETIDSILTYSILHGVTFIVMDNFTQEVMPVAQAIESRNYPYIYLQPAYTVSRYTNDKFNNITSITFFKDEVIKEKPVRIETTWDSINTTIEVIDKQSDKVISSTVNSHGLGRIPVLAVYSHDKSTILPLPPFYDIAKLNYTIYNKDSEIRDQERAQAFSLLYVQTDTANASLTIGPHNVLILPRDTSISPDYISPDTAILDTLQKNTDILINSIYQSAEQQGVIAIKETSGIAESYRFRAQSSQLRTIALLAESVEYKIADLFSTYIKQPVELVVAYTKEYDPFYARVSIDELLKTLTLDLPDSIKNEIKKAIVMKTLDHLDKITLDSLKEDISK